MPSTLARKLVLLPTAIELVPMPHMREGAGTITTVHTQETTIFVPSVTPGMTLYKYDSQPLKANKHHHSLLRRIMLTLN